MLVSKLAVLLVAWVAGLSGPAAPPAPVASSAAVPPSVTCSVSALPVSSPSVGPLLNTPAVVSRPLRLPLTVWAEAEALHEVVGQLRAGAVGGIHFAKVVIIGHSVGSGIVASEASTYKDVDGVGLTGMTHIPSIPALGLGVALGLI